MALVALAAGCRDRGAATGARADAAAGKQARPDAGTAQSTLMWSGRCGECHVKMRDEWRRSAHAQAARSPEYLAALRESGDAAVCRRCHEPLSGLVERDDPVAAEGVTCDACHVVAGVSVRSDGATFALRPADNVKYGPLCDAKNHYFHKMGCSPLHTESKLCAACHQWVRAGVPVFTEFEEWSHSGAADAGVECQGCHMPASRAEVAEGSGQRPSVPEHGFLGRAGGLRKGAVELALAAAAARGAVDVTATLTTRGTGHDVPTGLPEHRLILTLTLVDGAGHELGREERSYGRRLVDERGRPAPFWKAARVASDNRLAAAGSRKESWQAKAPGAREARAELWWQERDGALGLGSGARELVARGRAAVRR